MTVRYKLGCDLTYDGVAPMLLVFLHPARIDARAVARRHVFGDGEGQAFVRDAAN